MTPPSRTARLVAAAAAVVGAALWATASAHGAVIQNVRVPLAGSTVNLCAEEGPETIAFEGTSHLTLRQLEGDEPGELDSHLNFEGVEGIGLTTGDRYVVTAAVNGVTQLTQGADVVTVTRMLNLVSAGSGDNLLLRARFVLVRNANGEVTASRGDFQIECAG
jgi:hypothetical protein